MTENEAKQFDKGLKIGIGIILVFGIFPILIVWQGILIAFGTGIFYGLLFVFAYWFYKKTRQL